MSFDGAESIKLSHVSVELKTAAGDVRFEAPRVYQKFGDEERPVEGHFVRLAGNRVGFEVGEYDRSRTLVIDPVLSYSTYLGGNGDEIGTKIAVDSGLNFYVAGSTTSANFPGTSVTGRPDGPSDAFIAKFDPTGTTLLFATYLGGDGTETVAGHWSRWRIQCLRRWNDNVRRISPLRPMHFNRRLPKPLEPCFCQSSESHRDWLASIRRIFREARRIWRPDLRLTTEAMRT